MGSRTPASGRKRLDGLLIAIVPFAALFPLHNNDLWWHLASGRWIVANRSVPRDDLFAWTGYLRDWVDNEWLAQVLFFGTWRAGGLWGLIALRALLFLVVAWLLRKVTIALRVPSAFPASLAVAVALSHHWWELRPSVFTLIGMLLLILAIERGERMSRPFLVFPVLFAVWANVHPGFLFGLVVFGAVVIAVAIERATRGWRRSRLDPKRLAIAFAASAAATLVNPYGWRVYTQQVAIAGNRPYRMLLDEWLVPPLPFLLVVAAAVVVALVDLRRVPLHRLAIFFAGATLSMTAVRFEEHFAWIAVPVAMTFPTLRRFRPASEIAIVAFALFVAWNPPAARPSDRATDFYRGTAQRQRAAAGAAAAAATIAIAARRRRIGLTRPAAGFAAGGVAAVTLLLMPPGEAIEPNRYPTACLDAIPRQARLFNRLSWGGWIVWQRSLPVFIDGRCSGQPLFFEFVAAQVRYARPVLDRRGVDWVIVAPDEGVARQLAALPEWELACRDSAAVVFRRKALAGREFSP